jgi:predicted alpha/beta hydrolase family esterase
MSRAILIHGWANKAEFYDPKYPTASNSHWFPWLSKQLMIRDIHTVALEMPNSYYPEYDVWKKELERFELDEDTILVGHSCGGGFLVRYLSERDIKVGKVVLVAPWLGIKKQETTEPFDDKFFDFQIDRKMADKTAGLTVIVSADDMLTIQESVEIIKESVNDVKITTLENKRHFTLKDLGTEEFPELLKELE